MPGGACSSLVFLLVSSPLLGVEHAHPDPHSRLASLQLACPPARPPFPPARSVLFARLEGVPYLLCGLGDGHLLSWRVEGQGLAERKRLALGTKPVTLRTFK